MTGSTTTAYVAHLASDQHTGTACGEPWQGWQAPRNLDPISVVLPPHDPPRPHVDEVRFCGACNRVGRVMQAS